jgi:hypothetical protein
MQKYYFVLAALEIREIPANDVMADNLLFLSVACRMEELRMDFLGCLDSGLL